MRRLWLILAALLISITIVGVTAAYLYLRAQSETELEGQLHRALVTASDQLAYNNYRALIEELAADPKVLSVEVKGKNSPAVVVNRNSSTGFSICRSEWISNGSFRVKICRSEERIGLSILAIVLFTLGLLILGYFYLLKIESNTSNRIKSALGDFGISFTSNQAKDFSSLLEEMSNAAILFRSARQMELQIVSLKAKNETSEQVAHDIRSPLSALEMLSGMIREVPEEKRTILRNSIHRIRDIANALSKKTTLASQGTEGVINDKQEVSTTELIFPIVEEIVSEGRLRFRQKLGIEINFSQNSNSYGIFSNLDPKEFRRVISNLINNAAEALPESVGLISISIFEENSNAVISIQDTGMGIPELVLDQIGKRGATFNKTGGSGLGLYHAMKTLKNLDGNLRIESKINQGTKILMTIPKADTPKWFAPNIKISTSAKIIVVDDDQSIHDIWRERFSSLGSSAPKLVHLSGPKELRSFYRDYFFDIDDALFLIDYEFIGNSDSGVDLIKELGLQEQALLVTSRFQESSIRSICEEFGVKIIPKMMSGFVPIKIF